MPNFLCIVIMHQQKQYNPNLKGDESIGKSTRSQGTFQAVFKGTCR